MKKILSLKAYPAMGKTKKIWLVMKTTFILLFAGMFQVSASVYSQQAKFSMKLEKVSVMKVVKEIKRKSDFDFIYDYDLVSKLNKVSINVREANVEEILEECLEGSGLEYKIVDKVIMIVPSKEKLNSTNYQLIDTVNITGMVVDEKGHPLPGVSIYFKETPEIGTATDIDGKYRITKVLERQETLVFSFLGLEAQVIEIAGRATIDITMQETALGLDEVVVTGYQTLSRERATGSFTVLDSDNVSNSPNETIGANLESLVAGLHTTIDDDGNTRIAIRGESSLTGSTEPLVVVDGFAVDGGFESINRNDIEKITVLKDAAAASIWGAKAANGVVVIITKKGIAKKGIQVEVEAYTKFSESVDLDYVNPIADAESQLQYEMLLWNMGYASVSSGLTTIGLNQTLGHDEFEAQQREHIANGGTGLANFTLDTPVLQSLMSKSYKDQVEDLMLRKASSQNYNIIIRGQSERNKYSLSVMYNKNNDVMVSDEDNNVLINFRNIMEVRDWLDFDIGVMTQVKNEQISGIGLSDIKQMSAYETLLDENGNYNHVNSNGGFDFDGINQPRTYNMYVMNDLLTRVDGFAYDFINNPLQNMRSQDYNTKTLNNRINGGLKFKLFDGVHFDSRFQYERGTINTKNIFGEDSWYTKQLVNSFAVTDYNELMLGNPYTITDYQVPVGAIVYLNNVQTNSTLFRNQLSLNKIYGDHGINFIAGTEINWNEYESQNDWLYGYNERNYGNTVPGSYSGLTNAFSPSWYTYTLPRGGETSLYIHKYFSLYSNLAYTFKDKYTLSGSVRTDASNLIVDDPKYRYSPFWSVGGSWQLSKEEFMQSIEWLNRLTLRGTYGVNGNSPSLSASVPVIEFVSGSLGWRGAGVDHANLIELGNPTLGWEKVKMLNLAVDFAVLGNKLFGSIEYYNKKSEDLLALISLPSTDGTSSQYFNGAAMENKGFELNLNGNINLGKVKWNPILNFAYNYNMVTDVAEVEILLNSIGYKRFVEGHALDPLWYYKYNGLNADGIPTVIGRNGVVYDANSSISATGVFAPDLLWNAGSRIAPVVSSFTNEFSYKGFSLLATITGKFGHYMSVSGFSYGFRTDGQNYHENLEEILNGNYEEVGELPLPDEYIPGYASYYQTAQFLESRVENASFIKLRDVMLSYQLPKSILSKIGCKGLKLYAHVSNVGLLWTANGLGIDPEYPKGGSFFKPERTYTLGLNLKF